MTKIAQDDGEARPASVLLLEDDPTVSAGVSALLAAEGHEVRALPSIAEAGQELDNVTPDVLICDIHLPDGNSIDFYRSLRAGGKTFPVVFISGHADGRDVADLAHETVAFLRKPFEFEQLLEALQRVVRAPRIPGSSRYSGSGR